MLPKNPFTDLIDVASVFIPGKYTGHGKWMDGWESRRKRTPGHDWCIIRLGFPSALHGVDVDTKFFCGQFPIALLARRAHSRRAMVDRAASDALAGRNSQLF